MEAGIPQIRKQTLLSDEVHEVISYQPHWIVRKGNTIFLLLLLVFLFFISVIAYPDIIKSPAKLVATNPPKLVSARVEGKLVKLFISNGQKASRDQHLGYLESTSNYDEVMRLSNWVNAVIDSMPSASLEHLVASPLPVLSNLGTLQTPYQEFNHNLYVMQQTIGNGYYEKKKNSLHKDVQYLSSLKINSEHRQDLKQRDRQLQQKELDAYEKLAQEKVIAPLELNQYKSRMLNKEEDVELMDAQLTTGDLNVHRKLTELLDLEKQVLDQKEAFQSSLLRLKSEIEKWKQEYVLVAPEEGNVLFASTLTENQLITLAQPMMYIQPANTDYYVEAISGQRGLGKVKEGQKILLRIDGYPSEEFGYLEARLDYIANIPDRKDSFLIKASLTQGLMTNYHKNIHFRNNLSGSAEIITDNRKLISRIFGQLSAAMKRE